MLKRSLNLPLALHKKGFYYGYVVLAAGTLGVVASVPGQTMGVSVFTEHIIKALKIDRTQLSMMYMFGTLTSSFLLPYAGRLLDKLGSRIVGVAATLGLGLFLSLLATSPALARALSSLAGTDYVWAALLMAYVSFLGIRHFGQGQLTMASRTMMGRWFEKRRGLMLGISGTFVAFAFGVSPLVLTWLIETYNWQNALYVLTGASLIMAAVFALLFRRSPEHCGLAVDGGLVADENSKNTFPELKSSYTAGQAKRSLAFWVFNMGMVSQATIITAVTFHMSHLGKLAGLTSVKAYSVFLPVSVLATATELMAGYLSDRLPLKYLLAVMQAALALALLGLQFYGTTWGFALAALGFGISGGHFALLMGAAWPKLFGRLHLGAITGVVTACMVAGSALGPYLFSLGQSFAGDYSGAIYVSMAIPASVFAASFFANNPRRPNPGPNDA